MRHQNEPGGNAGVTINGRPMTLAERAAIRLALGIEDVPVLTVDAGDTFTLEPNQLAKVLPRGNGTQRIFDFYIPKGAPGKDGLNGSGTIVVKRTETIPWDQPANVVDEGANGRAELVFYVPAGQPGASILPQGAFEDSYLSFKDGVYTWRAITPGTGTGGTVTYTDLGDEPILGPYAWETGGVVLPDPTDPGTGGGGGTPTPTPTQTILDAGTYASYSAAASAVAVGGRRIAAADALIAAFGPNYTLAMRRNSVDILVANYAGAMVRSTSGIDVILTLGTLGVVSNVAPSDITTGTWEMVITSGTHVIKLPVTLDAASTTGDGFNPGPVVLVLPRAMDGV